MKNCLVVPAQGLSSGITAKTNAVMAAVRVLMPTLRASTAMAATTVPALNMRALFSAGNAGCSDDDDDDDDDEDDGGGSDEELSLGLLLLLSGWGWAGVITTNPLLDCMAWMDLLLSCCSSGIGDVTALLSLWAFCDPFVPLDE